MKLLLSLALLPSLATAQLAWNGIEQLLPGAGRIAFDSAHDRLLVMTAMNRILTPSATGWDRLPTAGAPTDQAVGDIHIAWDPVRARLVAYRSDALNAPFPSSLWEWDGARWTASTVPGLPGTFNSFAYDVTWDPARQAIVVVGRLRGSATMGTWSYDGTTWRSFGASGLPALTNFVMTPDPISTRLVLYASATASTWLWNGTTWAAATPTRHPPTGGYWSMATDPVRGVAVLVGTLTSTFHAETWTWAGADWTEQSAPPGVVTGATTLMPKVAFDPTLGRVLHLALDTSIWSFDGSAWQAHVAATTPTLVDQSDLADDPGGRGIVTLGIDGLWTWTGGRWNPVPSAHTPGERRQFRMVTDPLRRRTVLFGGFVGSQLMADTWEWDGNDWFQLTTAHAPSPRYRPAMSYDAQRGVVVLFGGMTSNGKVADTWTFDGTDWTQRSPAHVPPPRMEHGLAFDARRGVTVLFGGLGPTGWISDTWEWDGNDWHAAAATTTVQGGRGLAFDPVRRRVMLQGVDGAVSVTVEWDGAQWLRCATTAEPWGNLSRPMVFDNARQRMVAVAEYDELVWEFSVSDLARFEPFGSGCAGSAGTPWLDAQPGSRPLVGTTFGLEVGAVPAAAPVYGILGRSNRRFGDLTLPTDLGFLGMPGCTLAVGLDDVAQLAGTGNQRSWPLAIPNESWLIGAALFAQVLVLDPGVNPLGGTTTNAGTMWFGVR